MHIGKEVFGVTDNDTSEMYLIGASLQFWSLANLMMGQL